MCVDQMAKFIDHTAMFIDLTCIFRAGFWAGHPVRNARWGRSGSVGRGRSGSVGDGNAGGGPRNVRNSGLTGSIGGVGCALNIDRRAIFID